MALFRHPYAVFQKGHSMEDANEYELSFLNAMNAYRRAKESDDPKAIAAAEKALQGVVRSELQDRNATGPSCQPRS